MAVSPTFESMRAGLVARGLLSAEFALTEAGNAYAIGLIDGLALIEEQNNPGGRRVQWNFKGRGLTPRVQTDG